MFRCSGLICVAALLLASGAGAQTAGDEPGSPPPRLKPAQTLEPPPLKPPQSITLSNDREAIFLRADRLEGTSQKEIEANGKVELRSRRQTVT